MIALSIDELIYPPIQLYKDYLQLRSSGVSFEQLREVFVRASLNEALVKLYASVPSVSEVRAAFNERSRREGAARSVGALSRHSEVRIQEVISDVDELLSRNGFEQATGPGSCENGHRSDLDERVISWFSEVHGGGLRLDLHVVGMPTYDWRDILCYCEFSARSGGSDRVNLGWFSPTAEVRWWAITDGEVVRSQPVPILHEELAMDELYSLLNSVLMVADYMNRTSTTFKMIRDGEVRSRSIRQAGSRP